MIMREVSQNRYDNYGHKIISCFILLVYVQQFDGEQDGEQDLEESESEDEEDNLVDMLTWICYQFFQIYSKCAILEQL